MTISGEGGVVTGRRRMDRGDDRVYVKDFINMISPSIIQFKIDYYVCGSTYRCAQALGEYPANTGEQVTLRNLGEKDGVTLRIYTRQVLPVKERKIISNAANKDRIRQRSTENFQDTITTDNNLQDVADITSQTHRNKEPLPHTAVHIELAAADPEQSKLLQTEILTELVRSKLNVGRPPIRQKQGFLSVMPPGRNMFREQYERALPASSVANPYPFHYSGKTDSGGFYPDRDKFGSNIIVDFNRRVEDKTNVNILILGNNGQRKSYLLKLILCIMRGAGMDVVCLDPEGEYQDSAESLGDCYIDPMTDEYKINLLQIRCWDKDGSLDDIGAPTAFRQTSRLGQYISFLRGFSRFYKDLTDQHTNVIEIMVGKLYERFDFTDRIDLERLNPTDYPVLSDLYQLIRGEYQGFDNTRRQLFTAELLQEILLGLHSMCKGAEVPSFDGYTNITDNHFIVFGVRGLLQANKNIRNTMLSNILFHTGDALPISGRTAASIDEFCLFLSNLTVIEYVRNPMKRVRKKDSAVILSGQDLEDYNLPGIVEYIKPLLVVPTYSFLFSAGAVDAGFYMDTLQLEKSEYNLVQYPQRDACSYKCGSERYNLVVQAPPYRTRLFGEAGGR